MSVHGDQEHRGSERPKAEVDAIRAPDHPAEVEQETFAGAACLRIWHEVPQPSTGSRSTEFRGEERECGPELAFSLEQRSEEVSEASMLCLQPGGIVHQRRDIRALVDAMYEPAKAPPQALTTHGSPVTWMLAENVQNARYAPLHRLDIAKGERCREKAHEFLVPWVIISMNEGHGIRFATGCAVHARDETIEALFQGPHILL